MAYFNDLGGLLSEAYNDYCFGINLGNKNAAEYLEEVGKLPLGVKLDAKPIEPWIYELASILLPAVHYGEFWPRVTGDMARIRPDSKAIVMAEAMVELGYTREHLGNFLNGKVGV